MKDKPKLHDPVCKNCENIGICKTPCPPVRWIDGHAARREPLLRDMAGDHDHNPIAARDYKTILAEFLPVRIYLSAARLGDF